MAETLKCIGKSKNYKGKITDFVIQNNRNSIEILNPDQVKALLKSEFFIISNLTLDSYGRITNRFNMNAN